MLPAIPACEITNVPANSVREAASVSSDASVPSTAVAAAATIASAYARMRTARDPESSPSVSSATGVSVAYTAVCGSSIT